MSGYGEAELARSFRTVRNNTIQIAEDIPESNYDFAAAPGTLSVGELLKHIAVSPMLFEDMHHGYERRRRSPARSLRSSPC